MDVNGTVTDKYADIDTELEAEFDAELEVENEEALDAQPEGQEQEDTDEEPIVEEPVDTPANRAYAEQRIRIKELEAAQAKKDHIIEMVLKGSGMEDEEQFLKALEQAAKIQEQQELGVDDRGYQALEQERQEKAKYKQQLYERENQLADRNLFDFNNTLDKYTADYGFSRDEMFEAMAADGITVDIIRGSTNHDRLIKGSMLDKIAEARAQQIISKEDSRGKVDTTKHTGAVAGELSFEEQQQELLDADIAEYIKNKAY